LRLLDNRRVRLRYTASRLESRHLLALVGAVVSCRMLSFHAAPLYDDAFITFRFAANLAAGRGFVYNPGAPWEPILSLTAPGYGLLLALAARIGISLPTAAYGIALVSDAVSALLIVRLLRRRRVAAMTAIAAFAAMPALLRVAAGGMESPLLLALALGATAAAPARPAIAAALVVAACTVRPEAVLLAVALTTTLGRNRRWLVSFAPILAIGGAAYALALTLVNGSPVPHSVMAKAAMTGSHRSESWADAWVRILRSAALPHAALAPLLPLVALGLWIALRRTRTRPIIAFGLMIVTSYLAARPPTWSWYFYVPLTVWSIAFGIGMERIVLLLDVDSAAQSSLAYPLSAGIATIVAVLAATHPEKVSARVYEPIRAWGESLPERPVTILAEDAGVVGYYAQRARVLDTIGLVWPGAVGSESWVELARAHDPDYLLLIAKRGNADLMRRDSDLRTRYEPIARFSASGDRDLDPAPHQLPSSWTHDYLLYQRVGRDVSAR
jgi:arabinofuranosyltransferase